jgi:hypothetical protein
VIFRIYAWLALVFYAGACLSVFFIFSEAFIYPNMPVPVFGFLACVVSALSCTLISIGRADVYPKVAAALQAVVIVHAVLCVVLIPYVLVEQGPDIGGGLLAMVVVGASYVLLLWVAGFIVAEMLHRREERYYRTPQR